MGRGAWYCWWPAQGEFIDSFLHSASQSFAQECVLGAGDTGVSRKDKVPSLLETDKQGKEAHCRLDVMREGKQEGWAGWGGRG